MEITPGKGLGGLIKLGDSLNLVFSVLKDNAQLFGSVDIVVP